MTLDQKIAPLLVQFVENEKTAAMAVLNFMERKALAIVWPWIISVIPKLATMAVNEIRTELGKYTVNDMLDFVNKKLPETPEGS